MIVRAPGKLVVTGAYAVLYGAPAVVFAVNRYARTTGRFAPTTSPEFRAAMSEGPWPVVDTSEMIHRGIKMGLGSSAASLVAALAAGISDLREESTRRSIFERAYAAHRAAQGGGSGVDLAASVWGGAQTVCQGATMRQAHAWPSSLRFRVYFSGESVKTSAFVAKVEAARFQVGKTIDQLSAASERAATAFARGSAGVFLDAASDVQAYLRKLGEGAGVPIVTKAMNVFHEQAQVLGAVALPAGAGGGDVVIVLSIQDKVNELDEMAARLRWMPLDLQLDSDGVCVDLEWESRLTDRRIDHG